MEWAWNSLLTHFASPYLGSKEWCVLQWFITHDWNTACTAFKMFQDHNSLKSFSWAFLSDWWTAKTVIKNVNHLLKYFSYCRLPDGWICWKCLPYCEKIISLNPNNAIAICGQETGEQLVFFGYKRWHTLSLLSVRMILLNHRHLQIYEWWR